MAVAISYVGSATEAGGSSSHTFTAQGIGTAAGDRVVIVGCIGRASSITPSSVTIGGVSATNIVSANGTTLTTSLWALLVTAGTTADIVVTYSGATTRTGILVWGMTGTGGSITAAATNNAVDNSNNTHIATTTITIQADGGAVAASSVDNGGAATSTWAGFTGDADLALSGNNAAAAAHLTPATLQSGITVSDTWSGALASTGIAVAAWSAPASSTTYGPRILLLGVG